MADHGSVYVEVDGLDAIQGGSGSTKVGSVAWRSLLRKWQVTDGHARAMASPLPAQEPIKSVITFSLLDQQAYSTNKSLVPFPCASSWL